MMGFKDWLKRQAAGGVQGNSMSNQDLVAYIVGLAKRKTDKSRKWRSSNHQA